jgi:intracellular multiplication protein IcmP
MAQQPQQQGGGGGGGDNSLAPVWIIALLFLTLYIIWSAAHKYITAFIFKINILQIKLVSLFISSPKLENDIYIMQTVNPAGVTWAQLVDLTSDVGNFVRYPIILVLILLAFFLYFSNIKIKFKKTHNMHSLRAQEQRNWPAISPIIKEDLVTTDISKGPWAMALTPMEFARKHNLLKKEDPLLDTASPGLEMTAGIRRGDAKRVFTLQLGPYWDGFNHCAPHVVALAAVFIARMNRDRTSANKILETLDRTYAEGRPDFSVARATLRKYVREENVGAIVSQHAYLLTVMASLLEAARDDGVVPTAEFLWLKPIDRRLWYMLNCVGRQTPYAEVAGPFAHWRAEKAMGRRSLVPMIDEAIKALEIAVKEVKLTHKELGELQP